jgi:small GTP-binding protein
MKKQKARNIRAVPGFFILHSSFCILHPTSRFESVYAARLSSGANLASIQPMQIDVLSPEEQRLVADERQLLSRLRDALDAAGAVDDSRRMIAAAVAQLDELFLLVVAGEFNSGKSAFINALLGETVLEEGVTPTTAEVHVLQFGPERGRIPTGPALHQVTAPIPLLRDIHIVDTPGTNAVVREHETITREFVPRADLVLFVTSVDRPFTETERQFLQAIREWGKKIVIVINKVDLLEQEQEVRQVVAFVEDQARRLLGQTPEIFPVSARRALRAKKGEPALWNSSGFEPLERFIVDRLDERERLVLKLANPLGVGLQLAARYRDVIAGRLGLLQDDVRVLDDVDRQMAAYRADMQEQFDHRMSGIETVLLQLEGRANAFFDEMLRLGRVFDLFNKKRVQDGFERQVVADTPAQIERQVAALVDWMVSSDLQQWQRVTAHLADRRREHRERIVGDPEVLLTHSERGRLVESVSQEAQRVVERFDRHREAEALAESARNAVATTAAVGAGAVGLGAAVTAVATTAAADVTGIMMASLIATIGLFVIPNRRRTAKAEMRHKVSEMREMLQRSLREQFELEMRRSADRLDTVVAPYSRFVRTERDVLESSRDALERTIGEMQVLKGRIAQLRGAGAVRAEARS